MFVMENGRRHVSRLHVRANHEKDRGPPQVQLQPALLRLGSQRMAARRAAPCGEEIALAQAMMRRSWLANEGRARDIRTDVGRSLNCGDRQARCAPRAGMAVGGDEAWMYHRVPRKCVVVTASRIWMRNDIAAWPGLTATSGRYGKKLPELCRRRSDARHDCADFKGEDDILVPAGKGCRLINKMAVVNAK